MLAKNKKSRKKYKKLLIFFVNIVLLNRKYMYILPLLLRSCVPTRDLFSISIKKKSYSLFCMISFLCFDTRFSFF